MTYDLQINTSNLGSHQQLCVTIRGVPPRVLAPPAEGGGSVEPPTCCSLHTGPTLLRLLLLMPTVCPIGGSEPTPPEPPAMDTVMLMLLYTPCWPKAGAAPCPDWLNRLWREK